MTPDGLPAGDLLTLPRTLVEDGRHPEAVVAYQRALERLTADGDAHAVIMAKFELVHVALHANHLGLAAEVYAEMLADLEQSDLELTPVESLMLPLMFRVARGDTDEVLEVLEEFRENLDDDVSLDEMLTLLQFEAEVHELRGSPLRASYLLLQAAEMCERAAVEHDLPELRHSVAETYRDHALLLVTAKAQCLLEAESGLSGGLADVDPEAWQEFLSETLAWNIGEDDLLNALHRRILTSLDASDRWGSASHGLRFWVGNCRVHVLLAFRDFGAAVREARRVAPIGDLAGEVDAARALRSLVAMLGNDIDGPDIGR